MLICDKAVAELKVEVEKQLSLYRETGKQTHLNFGAYFLGLLNEMERAKVKEEIKAVLDGAGISYTVISPWETDKVLLDLKMK